MIDNFTKKKKAYLIGKHTSLAIRQRLPHPSLTLGRPNENQIATDGILLACHRVNNGEPYRLLFISSFIFVR